MFRSGECMSVFQPPLGYVRPVRNLSTAAFGTNAPDVSVALSCSTCVWSPRPMASFIASTNRVFCVTLLLSVVCNSLLSSNASLRASRVRVCSRSIFLAVTCAFCFETNCSMRPARYSRRCRSATTARFSASRRAVASSALRSVSRAVRSRLSSNVLASVTLSSASARSTRRRVAFASLASSAARRNSTNTSSLIFVDALFRNVRSSMSILACSRILISRAFRAARASAPNCARSCRTII
mmetsp:Transcript_30003/g.70599  ORF Transcript_30003/g.70599 Transcript_30003/m.70599 type:complete len:240 (-) Transcript_30003:492-1211(-)